MVKKINLNIRPLHVVVFMFPLVELRGTNRTAVTNFVEWCAFYGLDAEELRQLADQKFNNGNYSPAEIYANKELLIKGKWVEDGSLYMFLCSFAPHEVMFPSQDAPEFVAEESL